MFVCIFQDLETLNLEDFKHNNINLTGLRLIDRNRGIVAQTLQQMEIFQKLTKRPILNATNIIKVFQIL